VLYDQELNTLTSQGALQFFHDRDKNSIGLLSSYSLSDLKTTQQIATLVVSYAMPLPLGSMQLFTIGGNLKYNDGLYYQQSSLTGTFTQGSPFSGTYTKTSSTSGLGLSMDFGFLAKISDSLQAGMMFQNIKSSFNWTATQQNFTLDPTTGAESPTGTASSVTISAPFPYATRLGMVYDPQEKNIIVEGEVSWSQQQTRWRAGLERFYPEASLVVRFGTFADEVTNQQMWCFGVGFVGKNVAVDGSFLTRSIPDLQDSITLGGALDAIISF
jgi:hypothetical protein